MQAWLAELGIRPGEDDLQPVALDGKVLVGDEVSTCPCRWRVSLAFATFGWFNYVGPLEGAPSLKQLVSTVELGVFLSASGHHLSTR